MAKFSAFRHVNLVTSLKFSHRCADDDNVCSRISALAVTKSLLVAYADNHYFIINKTGQLQVFFEQSTKHVNNFVISLKDNFVSVSDNKKILITSMTGKLIKTILILGSIHISITKNGVLYLANVRHGVYQSTDNGFTWELVFKTVERCNHVIKVEHTLAKNSNVFWILEYNEEFPSLRIYTIDHNSTAKKVSWVQVTLPETIQTDALNSITDLLYDGYILLYITSDHSIHLFNVNGEYCKRLLKLVDVKIYGAGLVVDYDLKLIFIRQKRCEVTAYKLIY